MPTDRQPLKHPKAAHALDAFIRHAEQLPPEQAAELVNTIAAQSPPGLNDQIAAATAHARRIIPAVVGTSRATKPVPSAGVPDWLRLEAFDTLMCWFSREVRLCRHKPHPSRPQPVFAAAWSPHHIVCATCLLEQEPETEQANRTCDRCGHVCQVALGDLIRPLAVTVGAMSYRAGVCRSCYEPFPADEGR